MERENATRRDERTPCFPVLLQSLIAVISVNKYEIKEVLIRASRPLSSLRCDTTHPLNRAVVNTLQLCSRNNSLRAETEAPWRKWIDRNQNSIGRHRSTQATGGHCMPHAYFSQ